jgi:Arc/MetJ family transcription regulator
MGKRINIMIDEDIWRVLRKIPAGSRSRAVNEALRTWVLRRQRHDAVNELDALRMQLPAASTAELSRWIQEDREQGH